MRRQDTGFTEGPPPEARSRTSARLDSAGERFQGGAMTAETGESEPSPLSRRNFLKSAGGVATSGVLAHGLLAAARSEATDPAVDAADASSGEVEELSGEI